jgi:hypothetical protein
LDLPSVEGGAVIGEREVEGAEGHSFQGFKVSQLSQV